MLSGRRSTGARACGLALLFSVVISSASPLQAEVRLRTVVVTGDPALGTEAGTVFQGFYPIYVNRLGRVAFGGSLTGPDVDTTNRNGVWAERGATMELVARSGSPAPGPVPGSVYHSFDGFRFDSQGNVLFHATFSQPAGIPWPRSIWLDRDGVTSLVAKTGDPCVSVPGYVYDNYLTPMLLRDGVGYFQADTDTDPVGGGAGVWRVEDGVPSLVGHSGDPFPGAPAGGGLNGIQDLSLTDLDIVTYFGSIYAPSETPEYQGAIWSDRDGALALLYHQTDTPPGFDPGVTLNLMSRPAVNREGRMVFPSYLAGPGINQGNWGTLWTDVGGELRLVARQGERLLCPEGGYEICNIFSATINDSGVVFLRADASTNCGSAPRISGVWVDRFGSLECLLMPGTSAPGETPGVNFVGAVSIVVNNRDQIILEGAVEGPGIDATSNRGVWVIQPDGVIERVFRKGTLFDVNDDPMVEDLRTIESYYLLTSSNTSEGRSTCVNDRGEIAFGLRFTDATQGVFVASTLPADLCLTPGDLTTDALVNGLDIGGFIDCVVSQGGAGCVCADLDGNSVVDLDDVSGFAAALLAQP